MTPPRRRSLIFLAAASCTALTLAGCDKPAEDEDPASPPPLHAAATPTPASEGSTRAGRRALSAYNVVSAYLKEQDPDLREHLQKAASKVVKDKDQWRERLLKQERDLQPKIARLRDQLTKAEGQSADALRDLQKELGKLESQHDEADRRLSELESISNEAWTSFRDGLTGEDDRTTTLTPGKR